MISSGAVVVWSLDFLVLRHMDVIERNCNGEGGHVSRLISALLLFLFVVHFWICHGKHLVVERCEGVSFASRLEGGGGDGPWSA